MSDNTYEKVEHAFDSNGLALHTDTTGHREDKRYPVLQNVRQITRGTLRTRPAQSKVATGIAGLDQIHSCRRLTDLVDNAFTYVVGGETFLYTGTTSLTQRATGFSGKPLTLIPFQPRAASSQWMAVADSSKMVKVKRDGTVRPLGLAPPTAPPEAVLSHLDTTLGWYPQLTIEVNHGGSHASWTPAGASTTPINTTVKAGLTNVTRDGGSVGNYILASLPVTSITNINPGMELVGGTTGFSMSVFEVHPGSSDTTTVASIVGDDGSTAAVTGWATIVPTIAFREFHPHSHVVINGSQCSIDSVLRHFDGKIAFRVYIGGTANIGDTISINPCVYGAYTGIAAVAGETVRCVTTGVLWNTLAAGTSHTLVRTGMTIDMSTFAGWDEDKGVTDDDEMVVMLYLSDVTVINEIKMQVDVDDGTFTRTYYSRSIRPNDLGPVAAGLITKYGNVPTEERQRALDQIKEMRESKDPELRNPWYDSTGRPLGGDPLERRIERRVGLLPPPPPTGEAPDPDAPGSPTSETPATGTQWFAVRFKMRDFERFGDDNQFTLATGNALRFVVQTNQRGTVNFGFVGWYIVGGYGADVGNEASYEYRYRYRDSTTGTVSNWSPASRMSVRPHRQPVLVTWDTTSQDGADTVDIQRRGGFISDWVLIASVSETADGYLDTQSDEHVLAVAADPSALEGNTNSQPFTLQRGALNITSGLTIAGPMVVDSSARFNLTLAPGTPLLVNQIPTYVRQVHSTSLLEVYDYCGSTSNGSLSMPEQYFTGQPLPIIFGPMDGWSFGLGDTYNPGRLYFFNRYSFESTLSHQWIDVTDNSDPLMNGCIFNGRIYVWSRERMFVISPSGDPDVFRSDVVTGGIGMIARWALSVGDMMFWVSRRGIWASDGATTRCISSPMLDSMFSRADGATNSTQEDAGELAPVEFDTTLTTSSNHRLRLCSAFDRYLYFDYPVDSTNICETLVFDRGDEGRESDWGWYYDSYGLFHCAHFVDDGAPTPAVLMGGVDLGFGTTDLLQLGEPDGVLGGDMGTAISCKVRTFADHLGSPRTHKLFGDVTLDVNPNNGTVSYIVLGDVLNPGTLTSVATYPNAGTITGASRTQPNIISFDAGNATLLNLSLLLSWDFEGTAMSQSPALHGWGFSYRPMPEQIIGRADEFTNLGHWGPKEIKGLSVECDTGGSNVSLIVEVTTEAGGIQSETVTVNRSRRDIHHIVLTTPLTGYEARIRPADNSTTKWRNYGIAKWHFEPLTDKSALIGDWVHFNRAMWVQGVEIDGDTGGAAVSCDIQRDFSEAIRTISASHNGRGTKAYSFDPPFIAYMVRTAPAAAFRRMQERWIVEPESPIGTVWQPQEFALGDPYGFAREIEVEYAAAGTVTLKYYVDGTLVHTDAATLTSTGDTETFVRKSVALPAKKGRLARVRLEAAGGVRVRAKGTTILRKQYAGPQLVWVSFAGEEHNATGAKV